MWNYTVARVWGIPIRVNVSLLVFLPVLAWLIGSGEQIEVYAGIVNGFSPTPVDAGALQTGNTPWLVGGAAAIGLFVSVGLHELGHAWAGRRYGVETESITLWILGGLASLSNIPRKWEKELWIALAGPAVSVLVAVACYLVVLALPASVPATVFVFGWLAVVNGTLTVFNLLPAFPMDGGRVLRALLARRRPYADATRTAARVGSLFALAFALLGVLAFSPLMLLLALFVYGAANSESRYVALDALLEGVTARDVMAAGVETVGNQETVAALLDRMLADRRTEYPVADDAGAVVGVVSLADVKRARKRDPAGTTVGEVMREGVHRVEADATAFSVLGLLNDGDAGLVLVEEASEPTGVVTHETFGTVLQVKREGGGPVAPRVAT